MLKPLLIIYLIFLSLISEGQTAGFTYQSTNGLFCAPVSIQFTQTCTGNPTAFIWNFGNGQTSNNANPLIVFSNAGTYSVKLIAVFDTSAIETIQTIIINPGINVTFTADRNYICTPGPINFTATSNGNIANYAWDFGDGSSIVTTGNATVSHNFTTMGSFNVSVKATDVSGCFGTNSDSVIVQNPPITGTVSPVSGCIPATVNFTATATLPTGGAVTNYSWNFGDGSPVINSSSNNISHTYTVVDTFITAVNITTNEGCTNSYTYQPIAYGIPPTNLITYPNKLIYCGSESPVFVSKATNANQYFWDYGDGNTAFVRDTITQHFYNTLGIKTVTVTPFLNGCSGASASFQIEIIGVIAGFGYSNTCSNRNSFTFTNTSQGNLSSHVWDFGDGSPTVSTLNASHTYSTQGTFTAVLSVTDNITGCSHSNAVVLYTGNSILTNPDTTICRNSNTIFTLSNNFNNTSATYQWNVLGLQSGPDTGKVLNIAAGIIGNYPTNYVVINNGSAYCLDTAYLNHPIKVSGPNLSFNAPSEICQSSVYNVVNTSTASNPLDTVILWYWNYGIFKENDTIYQPPPIKYPNDATYTVKLVAKDKNGCIDSLSKPIIVNRVPFVKIIPDKYSLCSGQQVTLIAYHSDTLLWSPAGSVPCTTCDTITVNPASTTQYIATANNSFNCSSSDTALITVYSPFTAQAVASPVFICLNDSIKINVDPPNKIITWSPATGLSATNIYNPTATPVSNTTYIATLSDSVGCFSSTASVDVIIKNSPTVDAGPDKIFPYNTPFIITPLYSNNVSSYLWSPTGSLNCTNCPNPGGTALQTQTYSIKVTSDSGCVASDTINIFVECKYANLHMPSAFTPNRDAKNDIYYPLTRGISTIKRFAIFNRYGQLVFEVKNFKPNDKLWGWDGRFKGQDQSMDTYVYFLEAVCDLGGTITKKDSFILIR
ncbi:MAG TPA: PKD domain-containing protein [Ferruginibacter sp.]|nr:PKD domain-containing protein [Ferruginibacter sp.]